MAEYQYEYQVTAQISLIRKTVDRRFKSGFRESLHLASQATLFNEATQSHLIVNQAVREGNKMKRLSASVPIMVGEIKRETREW